MRRRNLKKRCFIAPHGKTPLAKHQRKHAGEVNEEEPEGLNENRLA